MKRMNVVIDEEALERARHATGEKTYSGTINRALREVARIEILRDGIDRIDHTSWWPGYVEEFGPNPPVTEADYIAEGTNLQARNINPSASAARS
jgi:hypothetical protein